MRKWTKWMALVAIAAALAMSGCEMISGLFEEDPTVSSVALSSSEIWMFTTSADETVTVTARWSDSTTTAVSDAVWASDAEGVATVAAGVITAVGAGDATITATSSGKSAAVAVHVRAPGPLADPALTWVDGTVAADVTDQDTMMVGWEGSGSFVVGADGSTAVSFINYPQWWGAGVAYAQIPTGSTGYFDFTDVASIEFEIQSDDIAPADLGFFMQWLSATDGAGGEHTTWLSSLGVTDITSWQAVSIDLGTVANDGRYGKSAAAFADSKLFVDLAAMIRWGGYTGEWSGSLLPGAGYNIRNIAFLDAAGENVDIAANIVYP